MTRDTAPRIVKCPTCAKPVEWRPDNAYRPFCSERCRQIDMGAWASESYRIPAAKPPDGMSDTFEDDQ